MGALDAVVEMGGDAGGEEELAGFVEVDAPGIGGADGEGLELLFLRVITPDGAAQLDALALGSAGRMARLATPRMLRRDSGSAGSE